nr:3-hydroxylacyl-ACP dehydratase [Stutzerimonas decontaminans]
MILLDAVERFDEDSVDAHLLVRADGLLSAADGSLPAWVGVEIMAQSVAAFAGCHARQAGEPVALGFLLGTRNYQCNVETFPVGARLRVRATRSLQDDNGMGVFECHLDGPGIHAEARLNVFRPPEVASYLQESAP